MREYLPSRLKKKITVCRKALTTLRARLDSLAASLCAAALHLWHSCDARSARDLHTPRGQHHGQSFLSRWLCVVAATNIARMLKMFVEQRWVIKSIRFDTRHVRNDKSIRLRNNKSILPRPCSMIAATSTACTCTTEPPLQSLI